MIGDLLEDGRAAAEALMLDACTIGTTDRVWDESTALYTDSLVPVYSGACKLKLENVKARDRAEEGLMVVSQFLVLSLPVAESTEVRKDMTVLMTGCVNDPSAVGRMFRVVSFPSGSYMTARRVTLEEVQ